VIHGNETRFTQVVTNLLVNAVDASKPKGGGPIKIDLKRDGNDVIMVVADRGIGMKKDVMTRIFDPMFTTKSRAEGTGLGLTIVHDIVYGDLNGTIDIKSKVNYGTSFRIELSAEREGEECVKNVSENQGQRKKNSTG
jgi:signal transduction histidine kinase